MTDPKPLPRNTLPSLLEVNYGRECVVLAIKKSRALKIAADKTNSMFDSIAQLRIERGIGKGESVGEKINNAEIDYVNDIDVFGVLCEDDAPTVCAWANEFAADAEIVYNSRAAYEWNPERLALLALYAVRATDKTDDAVEIMEKESLKKEPNLRNADLAWKRILRAAEAAWSGSEGKN